tara:strand:- start:65 stop:436 length:372 start_codon:yes stop_codon:yes gene_type:complete
MRTTEFIIESYLNTDVLKYVKQNHHNWSDHLDYSVLDHDMWKMDRIPMSMVQVKDYEDDETSDPYNRIQDFDDDTIERISKEEILARPIVIDHNGVIIDGNHRAFKAKQLGMQQIPAYYPVKE